MLMPRSHVKSIDSFFYSYIKKLKAPGRKGGNKIHFDSVVFSYIWMDFVSNCNFISAKFKSIAKQIVDLLQRPSGGVHTIHRGD